MFEDLTRKIDSALKKITGQGKLTEENISDTLREIRRILLDADVNYKVAKKFIDDVSAKAIGQEVLRSISPAQQITKIIYDELITLLGGAKSELKINPNGLTSILIIGLQGSGKTTFSGKLSRYLKERNRKVLLVAADVYRPAAIDQLVTLGKQNEIPVFFRKDDKNVEGIIKDSLEYAKQNDIDTVLVDTAGRLHVDEEMMNEAANVKKILSPTETLFVVDSMTGQDAVNSAKAFNERVEFDGIVLTKLDGDTKGGAALSIKAVVEKPIKFISLGEKLDSLEIFHPDRLASRILGKGDVVSLVEKAQAQISEDDARELEEKLIKNQFDFNDFLKQIKLIKKMGSLKSILGMIPGVGAQIKDADIDDKQLVKVEAIIQSMTKQERNSPKILNGSRRMRIARGSGTSIQDVNRLVKQFGEMQRMMKMMSNPNAGKNLMRNFKIKR
ncbi:MAG TPA: signal recognition particle protein [Ignavibacteriales bacterium]|nr:signal recognition particle protein [Ignavibacteriales bacterium]